MKSLLSGEIILYHGSDHILEEPLFGVGNPHNDYGLGFYCTRHEELAKEWACDDKSDGYCNRYLFHSKGLRILNLNGKGYTILHWVSVLLCNRLIRPNSPVEERAMAYIKERFPVNTEDYDVIVGYRADDSYFSFARDFLRNSLSLQRLSVSMRLGDLGNQVVIKSKEAFSRLEFLDAEEVPMAIYYPLRKKRDELARSKYRSMKGDPFAPDELYILDIIREDITADDPRLQ